MKKALGFHAPSVTIGDTGGVYEEPTEDEEGDTIHRDKVLQELPGGGVVDGVRLVVEDYDQDLTVEMMIEHRVHDVEDEEGVKRAPEGFLLLGTIDKAKAEASKAKEGAGVGAGDMDVVQGEAGEAEEASDDDDVLFFEPGMEVLGKSGGGEAAAEGGAGGEGDGAEPTQKRQKIA